VVLKRLKQSSPVFLKSRVYSLTRTIQLVLKAKRGEAEENLTIGIKASNHASSLDRRIGLRPKSLAHVARGINLSFEGIPFF